MRAWARRAIAPPNMLTRAAEHFGWVASFGARLSMAPKPIHVAQFKPPDCAPLMTDLE